MKLQDNFVFQTLPKEFDFSFASDFKLVFLFPPHLQIISNKRRQSRGNDDNLFVKTFNLDAIIGNQSDDLAEEHIISLYE